MGKTIYLAHFSGDHDNREANPAALAVMNYIIQSVNAGGHDLVVLSASQLANRQSCPREEVQINERTRCIYVPSLKWYSRKKLLRKIVQKIRYERNLFKELKNTVEDGDTLIVYHSLALINAVKYIRRLRRIRLILQVCEVYSDAEEKVNLHKRKWEVQYIHTADKYILMTDMMAKELCEGKPYVVCHGTYRCVPEWVDKKARMSDIIHVVYSGTLNPIKGGGYAAVKAAEYLPEYFHLHILGVGREKEVLEIKNLIYEVSQRSYATITYDRGRFGRAYEVFLQNCDIGLSTQNPEAAFNATSFPSKILSYMSNGLRVVSIRIPAIETSAVGKYMYYYEAPSPEEIAKAIMSVDLTDNYNSREVIEQLDREFCEDLEKLLKQK